MLVKVLRTFRYKSILYQKGVEVELTKQEVEILLSASLNPLVEVLEAIEEVDYSSYTKKELISLAEEKGVEVNSKMTKAEIIEELIR